MKKVEPENFLGKIDYKIGQEIWRSNSYFDLERKIKKDKIKYIIFKVCKDGDQKVYTQEEVDKLSKKEFGFVEYGFENAPDLTLTNSNIFTTIDELAEHYDDSIIHYQNCYKSGIEYFLSKFQEGISFCNDILNNSNWDEWLILNLGKEKIKKLYNKINNLKK